MKNEIKGTKRGYKGILLETEIGQGIDELHESKVLKARKKHLGLEVSSIEKDEFTENCLFLGVSQSEVFRCAMEAISQKVIKEKVFFKTLKQE